MERAKEPGTAESRSQEPGSTDGGGGEADKLTALEEGEIGELAWAPDGRRLAITYRARPPEDREKAREEREKSGRSRPPRVIRRLRYREEAHGYVGDERWHVLVV